MGRTNHLRRRGAPKPPARRPRHGDAPRAAFPDAACVACGAVQTSKHDSTLMCGLGHATCFACVAAKVQPHAMCGHACNGFKYKCAACAVWLCVNKTQTLALLCGGHALSRSRLRGEGVEPAAFESASAYCYYSEASEEERECCDEGGSEDTRSSCSSDHGGACPCDGARGDACTQLPRVCLVDWDAGREQRARRLARLRASLLGRAVQCA